MITVTIVICSIGAIASMIAAVWLTILLYNYDNKDSYNFLQAIEVLYCGKHAIVEFWTHDSVPSATLICIVTGGLFVCYVILTYNIRNYYKDRMNVELCRLQVLYAVFFICYGLRTIY